MIRKILFFAASLALLGTAFVANAQLFPLNGTSATTTMTSTPASSSISPTSVMSSTSVTATNPITTPTSSPGMLPISLFTGFIQVNGLIVQSMSSITAPATIFANMISPTSTVATSTQCFSLANDNDSDADDLPTAGNAIACPVPTANQFMIQASSTTRVLFQNNQATVLSTITPGDRINAAGPVVNGVIYADVIRDLSKTGTATGSTGATSAGGITTSEIEAIVQQLQAIINQLAVIVNGTTTNSAANPNAGTSVNSSANVNLNTGSPNTGTSNMVSPSPMTSPSPASSPSPTPSTNGTTNGGANTGGSSGSFGY